MTMGALHEGHASLIRAARAHAGPAGQVVVTVFVNPLQFGEAADLDRYPRTLDADLAVAAAAGADVVFAPSVDEVYPGGEPQVRISAGPMGERLEGASRPGHFDGMLTVVAKLLHLTRPDTAFYGQKDAQQLALIRRMVRDLNFPVEIVGVETVREPDGLALSSRNRFLDAHERRTALALSRALFAARDRLAARGRAACPRPGHRRDRGPGRRAQPARRGPPRGRRPGGGPCPPGRRARRRARRGPHGPGGRGGREPAARPGLRGARGPVRLHRDPRRPHGRRGDPRRGRPGRRHPPHRQHPPHLRSDPVTGIRLTAPAPGWSIDADVVVVGSGVAGLTTALRCAAAGLATVVVTKARLEAGSTRWAQGGIAAALGEGDTPEQHLDDTLVAGAGLCDEAAVRALVTDGPDAVRRLMETGARFDTAEDGSVALTREGGHHRRRIIHAGGDATGAEVSRALVEAVREAALHTVENALVLDLLTDAEGRTAGVTLHVMGEGQHDGVGAVNAPAVVLATGGMGQVFSATTNPSVSTGDGVATALRAGAEVSDLEFVQFHPTVLFLGAGSEGQQPLVSEAVRGEGAHLVDASGTRFMLGQHELAELAPRDIVAKGITRQMQLKGTDHMYLDGRHFGAEMWEQRFPTILAACRSHGIDPVTEPIPIAPAAHYASGGVRTDLRGRTTVPGLYACGEVACTGVHGANRLASNSLLEGLVFAERIAADVVATRPRAGEAVDKEPVFSRSWPRRHGPRSSAS